MTAGEIILLVIYFLPAIVASLRRHQHEHSIALLNLFLGWTLIGWVMALVWSAMPTNRTGAIVIERR